MPDWPDTFDDRDRLRAQRRGGRHRYRDAAAGDALRHEPRNHRQRRCDAPVRLFGIFNGGRQINFLIDPATALGPATITLKRADGEMSTAAIQIDQVAPGVFFIGNAAGQFVALATVLTISGGNVTITFTFAGDFSLEPIDLGGPADQVFLSLFVTGIRFAAEWRT